MLPGVQIQARPPERPFNYLKTWSGYHRRSLVETKMHCFNRLIGDALVRAANSFWSCLASGM